ncbi:hypothetical protein PRZ48_014998 [Zasmidium cellare]|uniref:Uncharacterized protein n=1 Tax=Zasmidium cellare TaxID=395010 RepID=A0ABR0DY17_ZASCE|nr:hypothetical protein PRZ48_014998 [Zasmidium cellare]
MRLLNVHTLLFSEFHDGKEIPPYIIASHRWGDDEATYKCVLKKKARSVARAGYRKVEAFCGLVADDDRTLQELLAPTTVLFVGRDWERIGYKGRVRRDMKVFVGSENDLTSVIHEITGIPESVLYDYGASRALSFEEKQNWVLGRETTREEDKAYCLLGIFNVSMPLVYGEKRNAQKRLLKEIQEKERERDAKRERKLAKKRKESWRKEKMDSGALQPIPEDEYPSLGDGVVVQPRGRPEIRNPALLPPASSQYEDASTKEHRNVTIVSSLRKRWHAKRSRDVAILSLALSLQDLGYSDPGASIHNALHHVESRSRQAQAAYLDMMQLGWAHERAVGFMVRVLEGDGHSFAIARAILMEYLMYDSRAIDVSSFPYIPAKSTPDAEVEVEDGGDHVDEEDATKCEAGGSEYDEVRVPPVGPVLENGHAVTCLTETKLSGLGVSRQGGPKIAHEPASSFDMFIQTHIFC